MGFAANTRQALLHEVCLGSVGAAHGLSCCERAALERPHELHSLGVRFAVTPLDARLCRAALGCAAAIRRGVRRDADGIALPSATAVLGAIELDPKQRGDFTLLLNELLQTPRRLSTAMVFCLGDDDFAPPELLVVCRERAPPEWSPWARERDIGRGRVPLDVRRRIARIFGSWC